MILGLLMALGVPLVFGSIILSLFGGHNSRLPEKLALAYSFGLGLLSLIMFFLGASNVGITLQSILISASLVSFPALGYAFWRRTLYISRADFVLKFEKLTRVELLLLAVIAVKAAYVVFSGLVKPMIDVDAFQFYSIIAKGIFYDHNFTHLQQFFGDKPLLPFLTQGWTLIAMNNPADNFLKLTPTLLFLCLLVIFYSVIRKQIARPLALLFTFLLSTMPFLVYHATTAYADLTITFYYSAATFHLFSFMLSNNEKAASANNNLIIGSLFLILTIWSKKAGLVLSGINIMILSAYFWINKAGIDKRAVKIAILMFVVMSILIAPIIFYGKLGSILNVARGVAGIETAAAPAPVDNQGFVILSFFSRKLFLYGDWHLLWALFLITIVVFHQRAFRPPYIYLMILIALDLLSLFVQFGTGETFRWLLDGTLLDRLVMNEAPIALFLCAIAFASRGGGKQSQ